MDSGSFPSDCVLSLVVPQLGSLKREREAKFRRTSRALTFDVFVVEIWLKISLFTSTTSRRTRGVKSGSLTDTLHGSRNEAGLASHPLNQRELKKKKKLVYIQAKKQSISNVRRVPERTARTPRALLRCYAFATTICES